MISPFRCIRKAGEINLAYHNPKRTPSTSLFHLMLSKILPPI